MKGVFKYTTLAMVFGLMGSSAAMAATGDPIGHGDITITANVTATTCSVNWNTTNNTVNLDPAMVKAASVSDSLGKVEQQFTLTNCNGTPTHLAFTAGNPELGFDAAIPTGTTDKDAPIYLQPSITTNSGIQWDTGKPYTANANISMNPGKYVIITPASDSSVYTVTNDIKAGVGRASIEVKPYNITYTYNVTYG